MSLLAPLVAAILAGVIGMVTLIWMNRHEPQLQKAPTAPDGEPEDEPSLAEIWHRRVAPEAQNPPYIVSVHRE